MPWKRKCLYHKSAHMKRKEQKKAKPSKRDIDCPPSKERPDRKKGKIWDLRLGANAREGLFYCRKHECHSLLSMKERARAVNSTRRSRGPMPFGSLNKKKRLDIKTVKREEEDAPQLSRVLRCAGGTGRQKFGWRGGQTRKGLKRS